MSERRILETQNRGENVVSTVEIKHGGTGDYDLTRAQAHLDLLPKSQLLKPLGAAQYPKDSNFGPVSETGAKQTVTVMGPTKIKTNTTTAFKITNFDIATSYLHFCDLGKTSLVGDTLYITTTGLVGQANVTINQDRFSVEVIKTNIDPPVILSPLEGDTTGSSVNMQSSLFYTDEVGTEHASTDWELSTSIGFGTIVKSVYGGTGNKLAWGVEELSKDTPYYVRARYTDTRGNVSNWSVPVGFITRSDFSPNRPSIQYPAYSSMDNNSKVLIEASEFESLEQLARWAGTHWQLSTVSDFSTLVKDELVKLGSANTWQVEGLKVATVYYARVRYYDNRQQVSGWSSVHRFMTKTFFSADTPRIAEPDDKSTQHYSSTTLRSSAFFHIEEGLWHESSSWQLATDMNFDNIVKSAMQDRTNLTTWSISSLSADTTYYARVRYTDSKGVQTAWSARIEFSTRASFSPVSPTVMYPLDASSDLPYSLVCKSSDFYSPDAGAQHTGSDWELSQDMHFERLVASSYNQPNNKLEWTIKDLSASVPYYLRVRHHSKNVDLVLRSGWSQICTFMVREVLPGEPSITAPVQGASEQEFERLTVSSSAFVAGNPLEAHSSTDWQISQDPNFANTVVVNTASRDNKTEWVVSNLSPATRYYLRVRYRSSLGNESNWSAPVGFTTKTEYVAPAPRILQPANNSRNIPIDSATLRCNAFVGKDQNDVHVSTHWQVFADSALTQLMYESENDARYLDSYTLRSLSYNTSYYARARHEGSHSGKTDWSETIGFTTAVRRDFLAPEAAVVEYPVDTGVNYSTSPTIRLRAFVAGSTGDVHKSTDWEIASDEDFTDIIKSVYASASYKLTWSVSGLAHNTRYYVRARFIASLGGIGAWSEACEFTTSVKATGLTGVPTDDGGSADGGSDSGGTAKKDPAKPRITYPLDGSTEELFGNITFTCSKFASSSKDTHKSSKWVITDEAGVDVIKDSGTSDLNKTAWNVPDLPEGETYNVHVVHTGAVKGDSLASDKVKFSTKLNTTIARPSILYPVSLAKRQQLVVDASAFSTSLQTQLHVTSDWELYNEEGEKVFSLYDSTEYKTSLPLFSLYSQLAVNTTYKLRVRYKGQGGMAERSAWSRYAQFKTVETDLTLPAVIISPAANEELVTKPFIPVTIGPMQTTSRTITFVGLEVQLSSAASFAPESTVTHIRTKDNYLDGMGEKTLYLPNPVPSGRLYIRVKMFGSDGAEPDWSGMVMTTITAGIRPLKESTVILASNYRNTSDFFGFSIALNKDGKFLMVGDPTSASWNPQPSTPGGTTSEGIPIMRGELYTFRRFGALWGTNESRNLDTNPVDIRYPALNTAWWKNYTFAKGVCAGNYAAIGSQYLTSGSHPQLVAGIPMLYYTGHWSFNTKPNTAAFNMVSQPAHFKLFSPDSGSHGPKLLGIYNSGRLGNKMLTAGIASTESSDVGEISTTQGGNSCSISSNDKVYCVSDPVLNAVGVIRDWVVTGPLEQKDSFIAQEGLATESFLVTTPDQFLYPDYKRIKRYEILGESLTDITIKDGWVVGFSGRGGSSCALVEQSTFFGISTALNADGSILYVGCLGLPTPRSATDGTGTCSIGHVIKYKFEDNKWTRVGLVSGKGYGMDVVCDDTGEIFATGGFKEVTLQYVSSTPCGPTRFPQRPQSFVTSSITGVTGTIVYGKMGETLNEIVYIGEPDSDMNVFNSTGGVYKASTGNSANMARFPHTPGMDPRYLRELGVGGNRGFDVHFGKKLAMTGSGVPVSVGKNFIQFADAHLQFNNITPVRDIALSADGKYFAVSTGTYREDTKVTIYTL